MLVKEKDGDAGKSAAKKMGVRAGVRAYLIGAPPEVVARMDLPPIDLQAGWRKELDYIHIFCRRRSELGGAFSRAARHLASDGRLFISWPKGGQGGTDLTLQTIIAEGYAAGLVESTVLAIDDRWSAIKFTWPKPGKIYRNSYGTLPQDRGV